MAENETRLFVSFEARLTDLEKGMKKAQGVANAAYREMKKSSGSATRQMEQDAIRSTRRINQAMANMTTSVGGFSKAFAGGVVGGIAAALAPMAILNKTLQELAKASELVRLSERIGLTTTQLQVLQQQAQLIGIGFDQMGDGLGDFVVLAVDFQSYQPHLGSYRGPANIENYIELFG